MPHIITLPFPSSSVAHLTEEYAHGHDDVELLGAELERKEHELQAIVAEFDAKQQEWHAEHTRELHVQSENAAKKMQDQQIAAQKVLARLQGEWEQKESDWFAQTDKEITALVKQTQQLQTTVTVSQTQNEQLTMSVKQLNEHILEIDQGASTGRAHALSAMSRVPCPVYCVLCTVSCFLCDVSSLLHNSSLTQSSLPYFSLPHSRR